MSDSLVTVRGYSTLIAAEIARAKLEACGVFAVVPDHLSVGIVGELIGGHSGIRLQVPASQLERARELLELEAERTHADPTRSLPTCSCPACGAPISRSSRWRMLARWRALRCAACGRDPRELAG